MLLYFDIRTISPILKLGSFSLISLLESIYVYDFISAGLIVLCYSLIISSNLSIYRVFETEVTCF